MYLSIYVRRDCVDPCSCGINAQCFVSNHKPVCYCPEGFTGNPEIECVPGMMFIRAHGIVRNHLNVVHFTV